jgi:type IV secretory pathway VirB10-like protein
MFSNRLAVAVLGVACITAAAGGGYFAARQNAVPTPAAAQGQTAEAPLTPVADASASRPVQETEALVGDAAKPAPAPAPVASPPVASRSSRHAEAPALPAPATRRATTPTSTRERTTAARRDPAPLSSTWPSSASSQPPSSASSMPDSNAASRTDERTAQEPIRAPEPPQKTFEELVVSADSVIGLQTENRLSSDTARVEDKVDAKVTRDVKVGDRIAIPAGSHAIGSVMEVDRGGKFKDRARLGIRFHTLVLADGTRVPISTETIYREGAAPGNSSAAKVGGGAVGGAILGAILGGAKGAAIGATAGAGGGTAAVMAGDRSNVVVAPGTPMTVRILSPVTVTTEKE